MTDLPVISLFSGAGGLDLGVEDAGGRICVVVEPDADCVETLKANKRFFPRATIIDRPIQQLSVAEILRAAELKKREAAILIGGPPCQPFSKSGYWLKSQRQGVRDRRASLPAEFLRVLRGAKPEAFIFENVAGLTHPAHRETLHRFISEAQSYGYSVAWKLLHAVEYGVPQTRSRVFVVGLRGRHAPPLPQPTNWWRPHQGNGSRRGLRPPETAGRWIAQFDVEELFEREETIQGRWERHLSEIPPGQNYKFHTAWAGHDDPTFVTETKYWTFLLKLHPSRPSWTIQSSAGPWTGPFHWDTRRLRVPELAALQTFPPTYEFRGSRLSRIRQIGNAVPCLLASHVAAEVLSEVLGTRSRRGRKLRFRLSEGFEFDESLINHRGARW